MKATVKVDIMYKMIPIWTCLYYNEMHDNLNQPTDRLTEITAIDRWMDRQTDRQIGPNHPAPEKFIYIHVYSRRNRNT